MVMSSKYELKQQNKQPYNESWESGRVRRHTKISKILEGKNTENRRDTAKT